MIAWHRDGRRHRQVRHSSGSAPTTVPILVRTIDAPLTARRHHSDAHPVRAWPDVVHPPSVPHRTSWNVAKLPQLRAIRPQLFNMALLDHLRAERLAAMLARLRPSRVGFRLAWVRAVSALALAIVTEPDARHAHGLDWSLCVAAPIGPSGTALGVAERESAQHHPAGSIQKQAIDALTPSSVTLRCDSPLRRHHKHQSLLGSLLLHRAGLRASEGRA